MEWLDFHIQLRGSWLFLLLIPAAIVFTLAVYRRTQPQATPRLRLILSVLRSLSVALLLLLLIEPVLHLLLKRAVPPTIITLLDTSASMAVGDTVSRLQQARRIIRSAPFERLMSASMMETWTFSNQPFRADFDTLARIASAGSSTDLSAALTTALSATAATAKNLSGVLLLSDGTHNYGVDPLHVAEGLQVPVYAIGFGDTEDLVNDVQISNAKIETPGVAGRPLSVRVELRSWGFPGRASAVSLWEGDKELATQTLELKDAGQLQALSLNTVPVEPGPHIYRVETALLEGEVSRTNNQSLIAARVAPGRVSIVMVAGAPSPDYAFLRRSLARDSTFAIDDFVQRGQGVFYGKDAAEFSAVLVTGPDVLVLVDVGSDLLSRFGAAIAATVNQGTGLLFIGGPRSLNDWNPVGPLAALLPFKAVVGSRLATDEVALKLGSSGAGHSLMRIDSGSSKLGEDPWSRLPPLRGHLPGLTLKPGATELLEGVGSNGPVPVVVSSGPVEEAKVIAALSSEFWRLDLLSSGAGESPQTVRRFWHNAVRWLAIEHPTGRVRASTDRRVYMAGEPVEFLVQVYDELMQPHSGAEVSILIANGNATALEPGAPGIYKGSRSGLQPGDYHFTARARLPNGEHVGESFGQFVIQEYSLESSDMRSNPDLLIQLAGITGGTFYKSDSWSSLVEELDTPTRLQQEERSIELWGRDWYVLLLVALLSAEWILRKRQGML